MTTTDHGNTDPATAQAWKALGGAPELAAKVSYHGVSGLGRGTLPVPGLARATVGACSLAAAELAAVRQGRGPRSTTPLRVDEGAVTTAFHSERHLRIAGRAPQAFAELSGFWRARDGWVRTHANYPHHRARLLSALAVADSARPVEALRAAVAERTAVEVQEAAYAAGGLAVAVTTAPGGPHPLLRTTAEGGDIPLPACESPLPATGVRVLDLTRVLAGPVATRVLGLLGADVLRVDSPALPEDADTHTDTGFQKRSTRLDLAHFADRARFEELLAQAHVVVTGYRPGALDRFGLAAQALAERRPGLVVARLCAWGWTGPWAGRRGFDSLVQAGYGIAAAEADADGHPGTLPAQALDHGTGYLLAAAVLRALAEGGGRLIDLSLVGTASWLLRDVPAVEGRPASGPGHVPDPYLAEADSAYGPLRYARPPLGGSVPTDWTRRPSRWGQDAPVWL
ncbi:CoA transferase [Streptomyces sp. NPDC006879]|uniref:CoA transferase n=1 Tax=Streptomyces sp. NPDC006879 TaxID=3364767 RepID=UPI003678C924